MDRHTFVFVSASIEADLGLRAGIGATLTHARRGGRTAALVHPGEPSRGLADALKTRGVRLEEFSEIIGCGVDGVLRRGDRYGEHRFAALQTVDMPLRVDAEMSDDQTDCVRLRE